MAKYLTIITYSLCALLFLVGCKGGAEDFFEGRPSEMSLVHNRIIEGSQDSMIELLKVPSRFPDATDDNISDWQNSIVAWWQVPEKRNLMITSYKKLTRNEVSQLNNWFETRNSSMSDIKIKTLREIKDSIDNQIH